MKKTRVNVFTGFLGAGKTSLIMSLIEQMPSTYKIVVLKNEFGDVKVDSMLAATKNIKVTEMLNGCMCCVLVGQMKNALLELQQLNPDRIIVETSGSAFPAPIAWQINEMKQDGFVLDSIATVVDCINFEGYQDTSYTAKMQAQYTDVILLNKWEQVTERQLDLVIDRINDLNLDTPKIKCSPENIDPNFIFGIDPVLKCQQPTDPSHHFKEIDIITINAQNKLTIDEFKLKLAQISKESVYRIKGFIVFETETFILNWAFERFSLTKTSDVELNGMQLSVMGIDLCCSFFCQLFGLTDQECVLSHSRHE